MGGTTLKYVTYFYSRTTLLLVSKDKVNPFMEVFTDIFALQSLPILLDKNFSRPLQTIYQPVMFISRHVISSEISDSVDPKVYCSCHVSRMLTMLSDLGKN